MIFVIGGVNMDIAGTPDAALRTGDSNPGRVTMTPGGVGRNIAENMCRLGRQVSLVTVLGSDPYADAVREHSRNVGIDLSRSFTDPMGRTSTYLCLNEQNGDLHAAVRDVPLGGKTIDPHSSTRHYRHHRHPLEKIAFYTRFA